MCFWLNGPVPMAACRPVLQYFCVARSDSQQPPLYGGTMKKPLSVTHPEIATQWHPTENGDLTPSDVKAGSGKKVWWKCPEMI